MKFKAETKKATISKVEQVQVESAEYKALFTLIESYKENNPAKYELKKETLKAKLDLLK